jgi:hypothetical protein
MDSGGKGLKRTKFSLSLSLYSKHSKHFQLSIEYPPPPIAHYLLISIPPKKKKRDNRVFRKVRKTQHQNPEFWSKPVWDSKKKNLQKSTIAFQSGWNSEMHHWFGVVKWVSSSFWPPLSLFLSASTAATYIFTAPTCSTTKLPQTWCIKCRVSAFHTQI